MIPRTEWEMLVHTALSELVAATTSLSLYQPGHPQADAAIDRLLGHVRMLLEEDGELPIVLLSDDLFVKGRPFTRLSRPAETFMRRMRRRRIEHVTFKTGVERAELQAFLLDLVKTDDSPPLSQPTIVVGRIDFGVDDAAGGAETGGGEGRTRLALVRDRVTVIAECFKAVLAGRNPGLGELDGVSHHLVAALTEHAPLRSLLSTWEGEERWQAVHAHNTCAVAAALAVGAGFSKAAATEIGVAGLLHDIGKLFFPPEVLQQELLLGGGELELILDHPRDGLALMLSWGHQVPPVALTVCLEHHLHFNGGGYPRLPRARRPHHAARLVAVADAFAILHSAPRYRSGPDRVDAVSWIREREGTQFDPRWCRLLLDVSAPAQRAG